MKQIRLTQEELNSILLREELLTEEEVIFNIEIGKSGAVIFTTMHDFERRRLNLPLTDVGLSKKITSPLGKTGRFKTLNDVVRCKESELLRVLNFGPILMNELKIFLAQNGLQLEKE